MKNVILPAMITVVAANSVLSSPLKQPVPHVTHNHTIRLENTKDFFRWFISLKQKASPHISPPLDNSTLLYFIVQPSTADRDKSDQYDKGKKVLTVFGGEVENEQKMLDLDSGKIVSNNALNEADTNHGNVVITIATEGNNLSSYPGLNHSNIPTQVKRNELTSYDLRFHNTYRWTSYFYNKDKAKFEVKLPCTPTQARNASGRVQIIVVVKSLGFGNSIRGMTIPLVPSPEQSTNSVHYVNQIDADLVAVLIADSITHRIFGSFGILPATVVAK